MDPTDVLSVISVNSECPADLVFVVKWLKAMVKFKGVKLDTDLSVLVDFFTKVVNSEFWPANNLFNMNATREMVSAVLLKARDWIYYSEVV
jgi:hypothetical protein